MNVSLRLSILLTNTLPPFVRKRMYVFSSSSKYIVLIMMILGRLVATDTAGLYRTDDGDGDEQHYANKK